MDHVDRMYRVLVRNIRDKHPALWEAPFTVGDLHQQILPYRHFRTDLEIGTNQEYELTLMELVSGARGYLEVDERLRDQLGQELKTKSPDGSRVREFADAQVSLNAKARQDADKANSSPDSEVPRRDAARCRYCAGALPGGRTLHYCPHCGQNLQVINCSACGAEVEAGWKFCVACGKAVA